MWDIILGAIAPVISLAIALTCIYLAYWFAEKKKFKDHIKGVYFEVKTNLERIRKVKELLREKKPIPFCLLNVLIFENSKGYIFDLPPDLKGKIMDLYVRYYPINSALERLYIGTEAGREIAENLLESLEKTEKLTEDVLTSLEEFLGLR